MRIFAGPNGSGKSTTLKGLLQAKFNIGVYVNADDIESELRTNKALPFETFQLEVTEATIQDFFRDSTFSPVRRNDLLLWEKIFVRNNVLYAEAPIDSYLAADTAEFIRQRLLEQGTSFTYETVMSHHGKIDFMQKARDQGYRVYLYFIATDDPEINVNRVLIRIAQHGHYVNPDVIRERYWKSLKNLKAAITKTNRSYIFDNSAEVSKLVAEITEGTDLLLIDPENVPSWLEQYLLE